MPNCFQLFVKGESTPCSLTKVDEDICLNVLNVPVHGYDWGGNCMDARSFNWYDTIGFNIAMGKPLGSAELRNHFNSSEWWQENLTVINKILTYLEENYSSSAWYEVKA